MIKIVRPKWLGQSTLVEDNLPPESRQSEERQTQTDVVRFCIIRAFEPQKCQQLSRYSDSVQTGRSGDRIPVGARFSAPVQTSPGAHPASYTTVTGSFREVQWLGRGVDHPPSSGAEVEERI